MTGSRYNRTDGGTLRARRAVTIGPMMKSIFVLATSIVASALPVYAADFQRDGQLPMYPGAKLDAKESSVTPDAIAHGVPIVVLTSDPVKKVDAWYLGHAKECKRQEAQGGVKYACPGGSIMIYLHEGQTQIALIPPMGGL
jgi:hypothetical protein